jgi:hypothetical protein
VLHRVVATLDSARPALDMVPSEMAAMLRESRTPLAGGAASRRAADGRA